MREPNENDIIHILQQMRDNAFDLDLNNDEIDTLDVVIAHLKKSLSLS